MRRDECATLTEWQQRQPHYHDPLTVAHRKAVITVETCPYTRCWCGRARREAGPCGLCPVVA